MNLIAKAEPHHPSNVIGRLGGNIPSYFADKTDTIEGYRFYITFRHPEHAAEYVSIFVPRDYDTMLDNNIYPHCAIKVVVHPHSAESNNTAYTIASMRTTPLVGYSKVPAEEFNLISQAACPQLIQDESYYLEQLEKDGYTFWMQIDEDYYPADMLNGDYIFGYGILYLYKHRHTDEIIAGFWQYS